MNNNSYSLDVLINGSTVAEHFHDGKIYIEGREGSEFTLRIKNNSGKKILAIISVDGLSVMDGELASYNSRGYILDPYETMKIPGWRLSNKEVAKFYFSNKKDSYAERSNNGNNVGIIGCVIFEEEGYVYYNPDKSFLIGPDTINTFQSSDNTINTQFSTSSAMTLNCRTADYSQAQNSSTISVSNKLGTGFGKATDHVVTSVGFNRKNYPSSVMEIYYDSREGLQEKGVYLGHSHKIDAFPVEYCKPPKNWR